MLLFVTVASVTGTEIVDKNEVNTEAYPNQMPNDAPWDLLFSFDLEVASGALGNAGSEMDDDGNFYSTRWAANLIHQYDTSGTMTKEFSIAGASGLRDLAYDGTNFYGGAAAGTIWEMDFDSETLVSTITGSFQSRAIAYNDDSDTLFCSNWADPVWEIDMTGAIVNTINLGTTTSTYGFAYENVGTDPYLWVFDQTVGATGTIYQWDLNAGAYTGFTYNVGNDFPTTAGIAGGLFFTNAYDPSLWTIGGLLQGTPDMMFVYELGFSNAPPNTPSTPSGPDDGITGAEYTFTTSADDPELDQVYYWFDWDDGTNSGWVGPYNSGETGSASHAWDDAGDYEVTVKAKDTNNGESDWSDPHIITIVAGPILDVGIITGGLFKVSVKLKNTGATTATGVQWSINLEGGAFIGKETTGTDDIPAGGEITVTSGLIIGFGATTVTVTAEIPEMSDTRTQDGFVLLFFIKVNPGGGI